MAEYLIKIRDWYLKRITDTTIPEEPDFTVDMPITIKKGENYGEAVIPCTFYTSGFGVDLNPSLVKKKSRKVMMKDIPLNTEILVRPDEEIVFNEDEDPDKFTIEELESCEKCGKKIVISEVRETTYRSCPKIGVRLSHKVDEDIIIPARFGISKSFFKDIFGRYLFLAIIIFASLYLIFNIDWANLANILISIFGLLLMLHLSISIVYVIEQEKKWWYSVRHTAKWMDGTPVIKEAN